MDALGRVLRDLPPQRTRDALQVRAHPMSWAANTSEGGGRWLPDRTGDSGGPPAQPWAVGLLKTGHVSGHMGT